MTPAEKRRALIDYLRMKADEADWHGVSDAANDLRELEARHPYLQYGGHVSGNVHPILPGMLYGWRP